MAQHVIVKEYNPLYPKLYNEEEKLFKKILGKNLVHIEHIGSTSVPNLKSKPIIDILVSVNSLEEVDLKQKEFEAIGYEYMDEFGIKGRRYLRKGGNERTHQIHIFHKSDKNNLIRHIAFKNYLIKHPDIRDAYGELKENLAKKIPYDIDSYCDGKDAFIKKYEELAIEEFSINLCNY